ncbi:MAG: potassium channel family protein [Acidobacteriota bacterium]|nr:potassium channel family protein [Acidobacteriota bacterium]
MAKFALTASGVILLLVVAVDVYSTVLDDRPRVGPLGDVLNRGAWRLTLTAARRLSRQGRHRLLNFVAPLLLPGLIVIYIAMIVAGFALLYEPRLATQFHTSRDPASLGFSDAIYFSGMTLTTAGDGEVIAGTWTTRLLAVAESATGVALISLTITYVLTVYGALQHKRTLALSFYHQAEEGANVARFIAHYFIVEKFVGFDSVLRQGTQNLQDVFETHVEHPVLHYFHTVEVYKSLPRALFIMLEACAVIRSCIDAEAYPYLCRHPEVGTLEATARHVLGEFNRFLGLEKDRLKSTREKFDESRRWRQRYEQTLRYLEAAGIETRRDEAAGWDEYRANREEWEAPLLRYARHLGYDWDEITGDRDLEYAADEQMKEPRPKAGVKAPEHD